MMEFSTVEASVLLDTSQRNVRRWCDCGRLKHRRRLTGNRDRVIRADDLLSFLESMQAPAEMIEKVKAYTEVQP